MGYRKPKPWPSLARERDYYTEAALVWLEADQVIRQGPGGARGLDDFARTFFARSSLRPDVLVSDLMMPGIDGFDATKIIRELPGDYFKKVPIIALTASTLHNEHTKFKESGMDGHVLKPFNPNEIREVLNKFLNT